MPLTAAACVSGVRRKNGASGAARLLASGGRYVRACADNKQSRLKRICLSHALFFPFACASTLSPSSALGSAKSTSGVA